MSTKVTKNTKWGKQAFRRKAEARKKFKGLHAANEYPTGVSPNPMQLIVLFRAFRVFASWAKNAHPCLTRFVDELPFLD